MIGLNVGSGQRRFGEGWTNLDVVSRPPDQVPDVIATGDTLPFADYSFRYVCLHHVLEHFGCGEADKLIRECWRVLEKDGSLLVFVPDMEKLAQRWLLGQIDDFIYFVNVYGAYQGEEGDRHRWGYRFVGLSEYLQKLTGAGIWSIKGYNGREIPGADIAQDWWVLSMEVIKEES